MKIEWPTQSLACDRFLMQLLCQAIERTYSQTISAFMNVCVCVPGGIFFVILFAHLQIWFLRLFFICEIAISFSVRNHLFTSLQPHYLIFEAKKWMRAHLWSQYMCGSTEMERWACAFARSLVHVCSRVRSKHRNQFFIWYYMFIVFETLFT